MSKKYALIIGNTEYTDGGLAQLTAPGRDTEDLARVLKDPNICAFDDVKVLLNETVIAVSDAIFDIFAHKSPDDLLLLYFSGHGIRDEYGALHLAIKNTKRDRLHVTAIGSDFITKLMNQSRSKRQVLILDCCNSGAFDDGAKGSIGGNMGVFDAFVEKEGYGRIVLTATNSIQFAWEGDRINDILGEKTENSLFTHFLVKGLEGKADLDSDGRITVDELYKYANDEIAKLAPLQKPQKKANFEEGEFALRENIRVTDTEPIPLPKPLLESIENPYPDIRLGAVQQLTKLVNGRIQGLALSARKELERLEKEDDSVRVQTAVKSILEPIREQEKLEASQTKKPGIHVSGEATGEPKPKSRTKNDGGTKTQVKTKKSEIPNLFWKKHGLLGGLIIGLIICAFAGIKLFPIIFRTPPPIIITATDKPATKPSTTSLPVQDANITPTIKPKPTSTIVQPVTITWWHITTEETQKAVWQNLANNYMASHPNVTIEITVLENEDFKTKLTTYMQSGTPPDIFQSWGGGAMNEYVNAGLMKDITVDLDADDGAWRNTFAQGALGVYSLDGKNYGVPWDMGIVGIWYNKDLFARAGIQTPPTTWTEFLNDVRALKAAGITPIALGEGDKWPGHFWYAYLTTRICGQSGFQAAVLRSGSFSDPCFVKAGTTLQELIVLKPFQNDFLNATYGDEEIVMGNGQAAMELMGQWSPNVQVDSSANGKGIGDKLGWFPFPSVEDGVGRADDVFGGGNGFAIGKDAPPEAIDFVKYLTSAYAQIICAQANFCIPVVKGSEAGLSDPYLITIQKTLAKADYFQLYYDQALPPATGSVVNDSIQGIFAGTLTPMQAAQAIEDSARQEIK